jgi:hypothetical protein
VKKPLRAAFFMFGCLHKVLLGLVMFVGFDYGTSNCAMACVENAQARLIPLYGENTFAPSTLYAFERAFIAESIWQQLPEAKINCCLRKAARRY